MAEVDYRVPVKLFWRGTQNAAYAFPRQFDGLLAEARTGWKRPVWQDDGHVGRILKLTPCWESGGTLIWLRQTPPARLTHLKVVRFDPSENEAFPYSVRKMREPKPGEIPEDLDAYFEGVLPSSVPWYSKARADRKKSAA